MFTRLPPCSAERFFCSAVFDTRGGVWLQCLRAFKQPNAWYVQRLEMSTGTWTNLNVPFGDHINASCWYAHFPLDSASHEYARDLLHVNEADGQLTVHAMTDRYNEQTPPSNSRWRSYRWHFE